MLYSSNRFTVHEAINLGKAQPRISSQGDTVTAVAEGTTLY